MIQAIGFMIAAYIITRMVQMIGLPAERANIVAKVLAAITILVTLLMSLALLGAGQEFSDIDPGIDPHR